jgi:hypothetical protein
MNVDECTRHGDSAPSVSAVRHVVARFCAVTRARYQYRVAWRRFRYILSGFARKARLIRRTCELRNHVTSCDLGIFVDQATEPVAPQQTDTRPFCD